MVEASNNTHQQNASKKAQSRNFHSRNKCKATFLSKYLSLGGQDNIQSARPNFSDRKRRANATITRSPFSKAEEQKIQMMCKSPPSNNKSNKKKGHILNQLKSDNRSNTRNIELYDQVEIKSSEYDERCGGKPAANHLYKTLQFNSSPRKLDLSHRGSISSRMTSPVKQEGPPLRFGKA